MHIINMPKGVFVFVFLFFALQLVLLVMPAKTQAAKSSYYDFGPYYNQTKVLGISFSSLENLPVSKIPDNFIPQQATGVMPGNPLYFFKQTAENVQLTFTFNPISKEELRLNIAKERLSEAKTLLEQGNTEAASQAMENYKDNMSTVVQNLSVLVKNNDPAAQSLADKIEDAASINAIVAQNLSLSSSPVRAEVWTQGTQVSKSVLDQIADTQKAPAMPEELSISIQNLRKQGVLSEEESNKLYALESRSQLREELNKLASSGMFPVAELVKLDESVAERYPEIYKQQTANLEVFELRTYQTLPQPSEEVLKKMEKWQKNPDTPPSNDIKPYLWYNRAQNLAKEVDLSNFSPEQQESVARYYQSVVENPTYSPSPTSSPSPVPTATPEPSTDQTPAPSPQPSSSPTPYISSTNGALPGTPGYFFNQLSEQAAFTFTFDPVSRAKQKMDQAERRLAEAKALAGDPAKESLYISTIKQYQQAMTDASTQLKNAKDQPSVQEAAERLETQAARHGVALEKGYLPAPAADTKLIGNTIRIVETAMDKSADTLNRPALPPALAQRLDDLKAQGLILPEESEKLVNSASREEARDKIRGLVEIGTFPLADAKKMDEAQILTSPTEYNQLVEVRKVEELQRLRSAQAEFAQTQTLRATASTLSQRETVLVNSIEPGFLKPEDLAGREDLIQLYETLVATASARPINNGQFGPNAKLGATPTPISQDAVLTTCPVGATFKQPEGCVWADTGKAINDYGQYKCDSPRQYYSFAAKKCIPYESETGFKDDAQPICAVGYTWAWQAQSCQKGTGGNITLPSPKPEPKPIDEEEEKKRSQSCPEGSSYKAPNGCVWDKDGKSVYDSRQYRCENREYYSFEQLKCVAVPKEGEVFPKDAAPFCKEQGEYWSWSEEKCTSSTPPEEQKGGTKIIDDPKPYFVANDSPFYFLKQFGETIQTTTAFTPEAREQVRISQADERLTEGYYSLKKGNVKDFEKSLSLYTNTMQDVFNNLSTSSFSPEAKKAIAERLSKEAPEQNMLLQKTEALAKDEQSTPISAAVSSTILAVDKAADLSGEPPIPDEIKTKIESLSEKMISEEEKKKLLETGSRVDIRLKIGGLVSVGALTTKDTSFLNKDFESVGQDAKIKLGELKKLEEIVTVTQKKDEVEERIQKNEKIVNKLTEFEKTFEPGQEIPAEIRPYVGLTRINEIAGTIRPDIISLEDFQSRKDVVLAVATLQEEFRPTKESIKQVTDFRRKNPDKPLPLELARIEALSYNLGTREQAGSCYLPSPPFPANTPCPPPGAAIAVTSYYGGQWTGPKYGSSNTTNQPAVSTDKDGKPLVYGQGPQSTGSGTCPNDYHWMYDSGGWCMANSGGYSPSSSYAPSGSGPGYTPYSPYYTTPGAPPAGYPSPYSYSPPSYYGSAPTSYTTYPPSGTVPGSGPQPTSPGKCQAGFHWMSDSGGWCMSDGPTYVPSGLPTTPTTGGYSPNLTQSSCGPGYYWDGKGCLPNPSGNYPSSNYNSPPGSYYSGWSGSTCNPPSGGCGSSSYWDYSSCSCRGSSSYSGSGGALPNNYSPSYSGQSSGSSAGCSNYPSGGCGSNGWFDWGSCSCKTGSTTSPNSYSSGYNPSTGSCTQQSCRSGEWFDGGTCSCRPTSGSGSSYTPPSSGSYSGSSGGGSSGGSSGSCPSGYHWMSDNGGWCMSDGGSSSSGGSTPPPSGNSGSYTPPSQPSPGEPAPAPVPPPSEPAPAPAPPPPPPPPSEPVPAPIQGVHTEKNILQFALEMLFGNLR